MDFDIALKLQALFTWMLMGIIWFVQLVHYPLFKKVKEGFVSYERSHIRKTAYLVGPLMLIEAFLALYLITKADTDIMARLATANLVALVMVWISTFMFQMGQHQKLTIRYSKKIYDNLLSTNWIRTIFWTAKSAILFWMLLLK